MAEQVKYSRRIRLSVSGAVQGVGFRPFIYRLATELGLAGWVGNSSQGVVIEIEGSKAAAEQFLKRLRDERPPNSAIQSIESSSLAPTGESRFEIVGSMASGEKSAVMLPDIATCPDCLREIFDPGNRRFLYPFTNCTHCGPRFSIIEALPYDRDHTTMKGFVMCEDCQSEYSNPLDRRFHAQPNACPACGPQVELWGVQSGSTVCAATQQVAIVEVAKAIRDGEIVAVKGMGGFHLLVDAGNEMAVRSLRERKQREEKPFAVMFPSLEMVQEQCEVSEEERRLLCSPEAPIVLLRRKQERLASAVAPRNSTLGVFLPYTPLHHLLLAQVGFPVVATSANRSDEPICTDEREALERLSGIASLFLIHNRPIARPVDDSVVRVTAGREQLQRRARGYAPLPFALENCTASPSILALGGHSKSTIALAVGRQVFVSQHLGDLETEPAVSMFQATVTEFERLYEIAPALIVSDAHPDYQSTQWARKGSAPHVTVQHHYAHILSCMVDNQLAPPVLGVAWDGTGYGGDGTIWGGEFLRVTESSFERLAHLRTFQLPGGEAATKAPCRSALGLLYEIFGDAVFAMRDLELVAAFSPHELAVLKKMLGKGLNAPMTSSAGRLFDAVASLIGVRQFATFEGQAAMELEFASECCRTGESYPVELREKVIDWERMIRAMIAEKNAGIPPSEMAAKFQNTLVEAIVAIAHRAGERRIVLSGGCFQNRYLTERAIVRLREEGFHPFWHHQIPCNDGGLALGQIAACARLIHPGKQA